MLDNLIVNPYLTLNLSVELIGEASDLRNNARDMMTNLLG